MGKKDDTQEFERTAVHIMWWSNGVIETIALAAITHKGAFSKVTFRLMKEDNVQLGGSTSGGWLHSGQGNKYPCGTHGDGVLVGQLWGCAATAASAASAASHTDQ